MTDEMYDERFTVEYEGIMYYDEDCEIDNDYYNDNYYNNVIDFFDNEE